MPYIFYLSNECSQIHSVQQQALGDFCLQVSLVPEHPTIHSRRYSDHGQKWIRLGFPIQYCDSGIKGSMPAIRSHGPVVQRVGIGPIRGTVVHSLAVIAVGLTVWHLHAPGAEHHLQTFLHYIPSNLGDAAMAACAAPLQSTYPDSPRELNIHHVLACTQDRGDILNCLFTAGHSLGQQPISPREILLFAFENLVSHCFTVL